MYFCLSDDYLDNLPVTAVRSGRKGCGYYIRSLPNYKTGEDIWRGESATVEMGYLV